MKEINKAQYAYENGSQADVDDAVQKIRDIFNDKTVDTGILEKAVKNGDEALKDTVNRGYNDEQKAALENALREAKATLLNKDATIDDIRNAASAVNSSAAVYNDLETAIKYASLVKNGGSISEKSFCIRVICSCRNSTVYLSLTKRLHGFPETDS